MQGLVLYLKLCTRSRRAMQKTKKRGGRPYVYNPRGDLLTRLSEETGMSKDEVYNQLHREREVILKLKGII